MDAQAVRPNFWSERKPSFLMAKKLFGGGGSNVKATVKKEN
jgi:hypothetical protein